MREDATRRGKPKITAGYILFWLALGLAIFQLTVPVFIHIVDLQLKSIHIILGISTAIIAYSFRKKRAGANTSVELASDYHSYRGQYQRRLLAWAN